MNDPRRAVLVLACLLAACAPMPRVAGTSAPQDCLPPVAPRATGAVATPPVTSASSAAAAPAALPPHGRDGGLGMTPIGDMLRRVGAQSQTDAHADERRLRDLGAERTAEQRLDLSYLLLARANPTVDQANQALVLLQGLDHAGVDPGARQFVRILQRLARQTLGLAQMRAELARANRQVGDLQDKIAQIKNLEVQLQDRRKQQGRNP